MCDRLMDFCKKHSAIYVFGANKFQRILNEYLISNQIIPKGYALSDDRYKDMENTFRISQVKERESENGKEVGFIISALDSSYNVILRNIINAGYSIESIYILSQQEKKSVWKEIEIIKSERRESKDVSIEMFYEFYLYIESKCKKNNYNLFLHRHLGDSLVLIALKEQFENKYGKPLHYLIQKEQEVIAHMYGVTNYTVIDLKKLTYGIDLSTLDKAEVDAIGENLCERIFTAIPQLDYPFIAAPTFLIQEKCGWKNFVDGWAKMIGISAEKVAVPQYIPTYTEDGWMKVKKLGCKEEDIILLAPEAQTFTGIPKRFWQELIDRKLAEGKKVVLNSVYEDKKFMGVDNLRLSINDLIVLGYRCGEVYSLRSGLCDCLSAKGDKLHVYYTPDMNFNYFSINNCFKNNRRNVRERIIYFSEVEHE